MATRGAIARLERYGPANEKQPKHRSPKQESPAFVGVYHHWDSYPTGLGRTLWELYHGHFQQDLNVMLHTLIDDHPAGWSCIHSSDFTKPPGFVETNFVANVCETKAAETLPSQTQEDSCDEGTPAPACYCHGDREEAPWRVTEANAAGSGIEWVYAFSPGLMHILSSFSPSGRKMIGMFGFGDPKAMWRTVAVIDLDEDEPDWRYIEENAHIVRTGNSEAEPLIGTVTAEVTA